MSSSMPLRCNCRKKAVTSLRCSRCNGPICPDCSRPAPVGMLCRECATNNKSRLTQVSAGSMALATLACLAVGLFGGWLLNEFNMAFFGLILSFVYGTAIAEVALRVTGRKRGLKMEIMAGTCAVIGVIGGRLIAMPFLLHGAIPGDALPLFFFFNAHTLLLMGISAFGAVNRIRFI